jgi:hypothetical protein
LNHEVLIQVSFWGPKFGAPKFRTLYSGPDLMEQAKLGIQKVHHLLPYLPTYLPTYLPIYLFIYLCIFIFIFMFSSFFLWCNYYFANVFFSRNFFLFLTKKLGKFWDKLFYNLSLNNFANFFFGLNFC